MRHCSFNKSVEGECYSEEGALNANDVDLMSDFPAHEAITIAQYAN